MRLIRLWLVVALDQGYCIAVIEGGEYSGAGISGTFRASWDHREHVTERKLLG